MMDELPLFGKASMTREANTMFYQELHTPNVLPDQFSIDCIR